jgi:hypothetical protein
MWQKGDSQNDSGGRTWQEACDYCSGLILPSGGYSDWRLPNRRELMSIAIYGQYNPSINTSYFPNCRSSYYWSSSTLADLPDGAWYVISTMATCTTTLRRPTITSVVCAADQVGHLIIIRTRTGIAPTV